MVNFLSIASMFHELAGQGADKEAQRMRDNIVKLAELNQKVLRQEL